MQPVTGSPQLTVMNSEVHNDQRFSVKPSVIFLPSIHPYKNTGGRRLDTSSLALLEQYPASFSSIRALILESMDGN